MITAFEVEIQTAQAVVGTYYSLNQQEQVTNSNLPVIEWEEPSGLMVQAWPMVMDDSNARFESRLQKL